MTPKWKRFEQWVADDLGLTLTRGSGNQWHDKGDCRGRGLLVEVKFTDSPQPHGQRSMRLQFKWLEKVEKEAAGRLSFVVFGIEDHHSAYVLVAPIHLNELDNESVRIQVLRKSFVFHEAMLPRVTPPWILTPVGIVVDYDYFKGLIEEEM